MQETDDNRLPSRGRRRFRALVDTLEDSGSGLPPRARVLDLGCRGDRAVEDGLELGFDAYGCDFSFPENERMLALERAGRLRQIETSPYRLPFDDNFFDLVFSNQVLEHVQDYNGTLAEVARVLGPEGVSFHVFPSRLALIEPHVGVPLAGLLQGRGWLRLWTLLGVRGTFGRELSGTQAADGYFDYLQSRTNYLSRGKLRREFQRHFSTVDFCLGAYLKHYPRRAAKWAHLATVGLPGLERLLETFSTRVVLVVK